MDTEYNASDVIDKLGGTCAVAEMLKIKPPSVSQWKADGVIPQARLMYLRLAHPEAFEGNKPQEAA